MFLNRKSSGPGSSYWYCAVKEKKKNYNYFSHFFSGGCLQGKLLSAVWTCLPYKMAFYESFNASVNVPPTWSPPSFPLHMAFFKKQTRTTQVGKYTLFYLCFPGGWTSLAHGSYRFFRMYASEWCNFSLKLPEDWKNY